jgi:hypothetical protein
VRILSYLSRPDADALAAGLVAERIGRRRYRYSDPELSTFLHARADAHAAALDADWGAVTLYAAESAQLETIRHGGTHAEPATALVPAWAPGGGHRG